MTETSMLWQGQGVGDAPAVGDKYSSQEYSDFLNKILGSSSSLGFVLPNYGNNLNVQENSPTALNVIVKSGAAVVGGRIYENTADNTITIATADATNPRLDRIIIRFSLDSSTQTGQIVALTGTPAATPSLPSLTQNSTTYEVSLAYVWVAATATTIANTDIHEEKIFASTFDDFYVGESLIRHAEFLSNISSRTLPPAQWTTVGTVTAFAGTTKPAQMVRGNAIQITAGGANAGMSQVFNVSASTPIAIKVLVNVTAGDVGQIVVTTNSGAPATITRNIRRTGVWLEELIYYTTESDATTMTIQLLALNNTDVIKYGQSLATIGYIPGPFRVSEHGDQVLIDSVTIVTSGSNFTFDIPTGLGYKNIQIIITDRHTTGVAETSALMRINGDSGSNYDDLRTRILHSAALSTLEDIGTTRIDIGLVPGSTAPANVFGILEILILDYESANHKTLITKWSEKFGTTTGSFGTGKCFGDWRSTSIITSILFPITAALETGSIVSIYLCN